MKTQSVLRVFVVLEWLVMLLGIGLSFALEHTLPESLKDWLAAEAERELTTHELMLAVPVIVFLLAAIVASVGLFFLRRWAAWLYLYSAIFGYLVLLFTGPVVEHPISATVDGVAAVVSGIVLGLAFFTDALKASDVTAEPIV